MHRCVLLTVAKTNDWSSKSFSDNSIQLRPGDLVKKIKETKGVLICDLYRDSMSISISINSSGFKKSFKKI